MWPAVGGVKSDSFFQLSKFPLWITTIPSPWRVVTEDVLSSRSKLCGPIASFTSGVSQNHYPTLPKSAPLQMFVVSPRTCASGCCSLHNHQVAQCRQTPHPPHKMWIPKEQWEQIAACCRIGFHWHELAHPVLKKSHTLAKSIRLCSLDSKGDTFEAGSDVWWVAWWVSTFKRPDAHW